MDEFLDLIMGRKKPQAARTDPNYAPPFARDAIRFTPEQAQAAAKAIGTTVPGMAPGVGEGMDFWDMLRGVQTKDWTRAGFGAGGLALPFVAGATLKQIGRATGVAKAAKGIKAYHGGADFNRFDLSHVGTGEGAQAFGHGGYFGSQERTGRRYKEAFGPDGKMYEVEIAADPNDLLDWDAPISQQPEKIKTALSGAARSVDVSRLSRDELERVLQYVDHNGEWIGSDLTLTELREAAAEMQIQDYLSGTLEQSQTGESAYKQLVAQHGGGTPWSNEAQSAVSARLRDAGVPGVRYADKVAGEGTQYVVFDDSLINIIRKYGLAGILAARVAQQKRLQEQQRPAKRSLF